MMKRLFRSEIAVLTAGLCMSSVALGYAPFHQQVKSKSGKQIYVGHKVVRPALSSQVSAEKAGVANFGKSSQVQIDNATRAVRVISDPAGSVVKTYAKASLEQACMNFVATHQDYFGRVTPAQLELDKDAYLFNKEMALLKYRVTHNGVRVQDAHIDCRFKFGKLVQVLNMSFSEAKVLRGQPKKALQATVKSELGVTKATHRGQVYRVKPTNGGYQLVLNDVFRIAKFGETYDVQIESVTGEIYQQRPLHHYVDGSISAETYPRWWQEDLEETEVGQAEIETTAGNVMSDMTGRFSADADSEPVLNGFKGPQVNVASSTGDVVSIEAVLSEDIYAIQQVRETEVEMYEGMETSQAMIFIHVNKIVNRARGFVTNDWFDEQLPANANLDRSCNAFWNGTSINFFTAGESGDNVCANTGLISDVVYHEWGHGYDANSGGIEDGAFSEGFGDIMSVVFTADNILGIGFRTDGSEVRNMEPDKIYPDDQSPSVHAEGLIIGGTFWDLHKLLVEEHGEEMGREIFAKYAFNVIVAASRYTEAYEALKVIDDDDADLSNGTPNLCLLNEAFNAHGLAEVDNKCLVGDFANPFSEAVGNGNGYIEPGETIELAVTLTNSTDEDQMAVTGTAALGMDVAGISITQDVLDFGDVAVGETAAVASPVSLMIGEEVACGQSFDLVYSVASATREATFKDTLLVGNKVIGDEFMAAAMDLPLDITDLETITTDLVIDGDDWAADTPINSAHLSFEITHSYSGDLVVSLISPAGESFQVYAGRDSSANVSFDMDVTEIVGGQLGMGTWQLAVTDRYDADEGTLDMVELVVTPATFVCED